MSYYNELNELYMEKVAARSYGRNSDGSKRTAEQLIEQLGGGAPHPYLNTKEKKLSEAYYDPRAGKFKLRSEIFLTNDGKYNYTHTSSKRKEFAKELKIGKNYTEKLERQHSIYKNRLPIAIYGKDTDANSLRDKLRKLNEKNDIRDTFSGRHPSPRIFGDKAKEYTKSDREIIKGQIDRHKKMYSSKAPYAILAAGLLAAGAAETKHLYDKIKAKREAENKNKSKKTDLVNA